MLVSESRPRDLKWVHAAPLLYGDWGTSRLYVLGLAFLYTAHASVVYLAAIGLLMVAVSWAYTIVCRCFPDGGGVYTAARKLSPTVSVVGATLLLSGYIMTAAISVVEAFHYFGVPHNLTLPLSVVTILLIGGVNWFGARAAGRFALVVAFAALGLSGVLALLCLPFFFKGLRTIEFSYFTQHSSPAGAWVSFTRICLALAGVEAVANMTGIMTHPVKKTAAKTIWPVTTEVVALNMLFGIALAGLSFTVGGIQLADQDRPHAVMEHEGELTDAEKGRVKEYTNAAMKVVAAETGDWWSDTLSLTPKTEPHASTEPAAQTPDEHATLDAEHTALGGFLGQAAGITFGLLLLSATNTAVMAMVSVLFAMAQDRELPKQLTKLNYSGVPWVGLIVALAIPIGVISWTTDVTLLAKLYVLGVCGAITVSVGSAAINKELEVGPLSRIGLYALAVFLGAVSLTIAVTEPISTAFSGGLVAVVLAARFAKSKLTTTTPDPIPEPITGWLAEAKLAAVQIDPDKPRIMLAARGRFQFEYAVDIAKRRDATLFAVFVRSIRVLDLRAGSVPTIDSDAEAQESLGSVGLLAKANGVPFVPIYVVSPDIAGEILDFTVTHGCDTLIMGKTRRPFFARQLAGDVVATVAQNLPDEVALITRSPDKPHTHKLAMPVGTELSSESTRGDS